MESALSFLVWITGNWPQVVTWSIAILGVFGTIVWRYKLWDEKRREKSRLSAKDKESKALAIKEIIKDHEALKDVVERQGILCSKLITVCINAGNLARENKGRLDERLSGTNIKTEVSSALQELGITIHPDNSDDKGHGK